VAAYLADEDADVHNVTEAAVQEDALMAALNLTRLAAAAVNALAAATGRASNEILRSLHEATPRDWPHQPGSVERLRDSASAAQVVYPDALDDVDWAMIEAKGWLEVTVRWADGERVITFYDPVRLAQTVHDELAQQGHFAEPGLVVVPAVTKDAIESTVTVMAQHNVIEVR
jgi:hypothetical protein